MGTANRFCLISFLGSVAVIAVERGSYFLTRETLGFSEAANLWLALVFGATYVAGSLSSHAAARRVGERRLLHLLNAAQLVVYLALAAWPTTAPIFAGMAALGFLYGQMWPVVESYVCAGLGADATRRALGRFNLSWSAAVPLTLALAGPLIAWQPRGLFLGPALLNAVIVFVILPAPARPHHLPDDDPARPPAAELARLAELLAAHRWLMLVSYAALFVLAPLMPELFARLGVAVGPATALSGLLDVMRLVAFAALGAYAGWHGQRWLAWVGAALLPLGFFAVLFGGHAALVIGGEIVFGLAMGAIYFGALHYAQLVRNAAVDAGGAHEGLIGSGFVLGPAICLVGLGLRPWLSAPLAGPMLTLVPMFALATFFALRALHRAGKVAVEVEGS